MPPFIPTSLRTTAGTQTTTQKAHGAIPETQWWNGRSVPSPCVVCHSTPETPSFTGKHCTETDTKAVKEKVKEGECLHGQ